MRILGIDYGGKKSGLAFGESTAKVALPLEVIPNEGEKLFDILKKKIESEGIEAVVVGVPLSTGSHHGSKQLERNRAFISELGTHVSIPIFEEDESFTTAESLRLQVEEGAAADEDALAAMIILQAYFDRVEAVGS